MLGLGGKPARAGWAIDLRGLASVIDYPARDMTITVQAGITFAALHTILAAENQRLPIDVPRPTATTLGGAMADNISGSRRFGFGTLRDYVIGISTINDEGQETKAGGRVVKNVAGYDLCKLHIGALGTLGIITQVTLKVRPKLEASALFTLSCDDGSVAALVDQLHQTRTPARQHRFAQSCGRSDIWHRGTASKCLRRLGRSSSVSRKANSAVRWQVGQLMTEAAATSGVGIKARAGSACCDPFGRDWRAVTRSRRPTIVQSEFARPPAWWRFVPWPPLSPKHPHCSPRPVRALSWRHVAAITDARAREVTRTLLESAVAARGQSRDPALSPGLEGAPAILGQTARRDAD